MASCQYFTDYSGEPGSCCALATLALDQGFSSPILVCELHADRIIERFPDLGGRERFVPIVCEPLTIEDVKDALAVGRAERLEAAKRIPKRR